MLFTSKFPYGCYLLNFSASHAHLNMVYTHNHLADPTMPTTLKRKKDIKNMHIEVQEKIMADILVNFFMTML